jgi:hypothetical protein
MTKTTKQSFTFLRKKKIILQVTHHNEVKKEPLAETTPEGNIKCGRIKTDTNKLKI